MANATTPVIQINEGNVGIGANNPEYKLHVSGVGYYSSQLTIDGFSNNQGLSFRKGFAPTNVGIRAKAITTANRDGLELLGYNGIDFTINNGDSVAMRINGQGNTGNEGNVGIGTSTPNRLLTIQTNNSSWGSMRIYRDSATLGETGIGFFGTSTQATNEAWVIGEGGWGNVGDFTIGNENGGAGGSVRMLIQRDGSVGIGNTSPDEKLEVSGSSATDYPSIKISNPGQTGRYMRIGMIDAVNHCIEANGGSTYLTFKTNATEKMRISNAGWVGIDQTNPTNQLHVHANADNAYAIRIEGSTNNGSGVWTGLGIGGESTNSKSALLFEDVGVSYARGKLHLCVNNELNQNIATPADAKLTVSNNGNVGIGTTTPYGKLDVAGNIRLQSANEIYFGGTGSIPYWNVGVENTTNNNFEIAGVSYYSGDRDILLTPVNNGNVGIKNTAPSYALDVTGTIRATGDVIAYSDARVKDNVITIDNALEKVTKLRGVSYTRNDVEDKTTKVGVIAQEVLEVLPEVVQQDDEGKYSVAYGNMVGLLIESIKELKVEVDLLKSKPCTCNKCNCNI